MRCLFMPMKIFKFLANGVMVIVEAYTHPRNYIRPERGFYKDRANLVGDVKKFGGDMRQVIRRKRVERAYERPSH